MSDAEHTRISAGLEAHWDAMVDRMEALERLIRIAGRDSWEVDEDDAFQQAIEAARGCIERARSRAYGLRDRYRLDQGPVEET